MGLDKARGEWIWFIDPDDWIAADALKVLSDSIKDNNCDTVFFGIEYYDKSGTLLGKEDRKLLLNTAKDHTLTLEDYPPQNYLAKREVIEAYNLRFSEGIATGEDLEFQYKYLMVCKKPISIDSRLYCCLRRQGSAMRNPRTRENMAKDSPRVLRNLVDFILKHEIPESPWLAARLNRTFKAAMRNNYLIADYRDGVQQWIREADKRLRQAGFSQYSDMAVKTGVFDLRLYFLFQDLRRLLRR